jgi:hypothetical protein
MRKSPRLMSPGSILLLLIAAALSSACPATTRSGDDDRPVIIISSGSVKVDVSPAIWTRESGPGKKYRQKDSDGKSWKSVKSFTATTGSCTVSGETLTITYGTRSFTLERKKSGLFGKHDPVVQFADDALVTETSPSILTVATDDGLVSVRNGQGNNCAVAGGRLEVQQIH